MQAAVKRDCLKRMAERAEGLEINPLTPEEISRFWAQVQIGDKSECWPWLGSKSGKYGRFFIRGAYQLSHRLSFRLAFGKFPFSNIVCHRCDNPPCCNPEHLFGGTPDDNARDKVSKGRSCYGQKHACAVLSEQDVISIRFQHSQGRKTKQLAKDYCVAPKTIFDAVKRRTWKHIPPMLPTEGSGA